MSEHAQKYYRAVILPDWRITAESVDLTDSSFTQDGPAPGAPEPQQDTEMVLESSGSQSASGSLSIQTMKAGMPGTNGATFAWQQSGDTTWRGHDEPVLITAWECISYTNLTAGTTLFPHIITLADDQVLLALTGTDAGTGTLRTKCYRRATDGTWGAIVTIASEAYDSGFYSHPTLVELPSGRVLCFSWTYNATTTTAQVQMHFSDDLGDTWSLGATNCLDDSIDVSTITPGKMRAAYSAGQILLVAHLVDTSLTVDDVLAQYASSDLGASFGTVEIQGGASVSDSDGYPEVLASMEGGFIVGFNSKLASGSGLKVKRLGSAFAPLSDQTVIDAGVSTEDGHTVDGSSIFTDGDLAMCYDDVGRLWMYYRVPASTEPVWARVSYDDGRSWTDPHSGAVFDLEESATHPTHLSATWQRGRVLFAHNYDTDTGYDESISVAYLGGYSDVVMGWSANTLLTAGKNARSDFVITWLPLDVPNNVSWTSSAGGGTATLTGDYLDISTSALQNLYYYQSRATSTNDGWTAMAIVSVQTGAVTLRVETDTGAAASYSVSVVLNVSTTTLTFTDDNAASIGTYAIAADTYYQVLVSLYKDAASCWVRPYSTGEDRQWTLVGTDASLTDGGGGQDRISWGRLTNGASDSEWVAVCYGYGAYADKALASGQTNPDDLIGMPYSPRPVYVDDGVRIAAVDGPSFIGDEWAVDTTYRFPVENCMPTESPSPSETWRTTTASGDTDIVWQLDSSADAYHPTDLLGLYVESNAARIEIAGEVTPGGGYTTLAVLDKAIPVEQVRKGYSFRVTYPTSATYTTPVSGWVDEDELVGMTYTSRPSLSELWRPIVRNSRGYLSKGSTLDPIIYVDDIGGTINASGGGSFVAPRGWLVIPLGGVRYSSIRARINVGPATVYPDADGGATAKFDTGLILIGSVYVLGWDPAQEQTLTLEHGTDVSESPSGAVTTRERAKPRRIRQVQWAEGVDIGPLIDDEDDEVYAGSTGMVQAQRHDAPLTIDSLYRYLNGMAKPIVYLPKMPHASGPVSGVLNRAEGAIYGRIDDSGLTRQVLIGEEGREVWRVGFTVREEL